MTQQTRDIQFDGHRLAYRVSGQGPALVALSLYRRREDMMQASVLSDTYQVFQVTPLGYGYSDRVPGYAGDRLAEQVLRVLDHHGVDLWVPRTPSAQLGPGVLDEECSGRGTGDGMARSAWRSL